MNKGPAERAAEREIVWDYTTERGDCEIKVKGGGVLTQQLAQRICHRYNNYASIEQENQRLRELLQRIVNECNVEGPAQLMGEVGKLLLIKGEQLSADCSRQW